MNFVTDNIDKYTPIKKVNGKYIVSWGLTKNNNDTYTWKYYITNRKPTPETIKEEINTYINENVKKSIINDFTWNGMKVYLSLENQIDYKLLFDITLLQDGTNLPEVIKLKQGKETVHYSIESVEEFKDFMLSMNRHIRECLKQGRELKESIDYSEYTK